MKKAIIVLFILFFGRICFGQDIVPKKEVVVTGTLTNLYPAGYHGKVHIPLTGYNAKTEQTKNYSATFQSTDSFYFRLELDKPQLLSLLYIPVFILPGDSIHVDYLSVDEEKKGSLKSGFTKMFSKLGFEGNLGYGSMVSDKKYFLMFGTRGLRGKNDADQLIDSLCRDLQETTFQYLKEHPVSEDYRDMIQRNLALLKADAKLEAFAGDSIKTIRVVKENLRVFENNEPNTTEYFSATGSLAEAFGDMFPDDPVGALDELKKYVGGETYTYASLILANVLIQKLPADKNPFSASIALLALDNSGDPDLVSFANLILSRQKVAAEAGKIFGRIQVISIGGDTTTIGKILTDKTGKLKYVDLWASWCGPCIVEIPGSKKLKNRFPAGEVETFFISIDENLTDWRKACEKLDMQKEESYCILDKKNLDILGRALQIEAIPRYLILDSSNQIQALRAPRPERVTDKLLSSFLTKRSGEGLPPPPPPALKSN